MAEQQTPGNSVPSGLSNGLEHRERLDLDAVVNQGRRKAKVCVIGPSKKFFSGVSAYTMFLAKALTGANEVCLVLFRNLLPRFLYPGKKHVGRVDYPAGLLPEVPVYDGMDWNSPVSWVRAYRFLKRRQPDTIIMQWWTSSVVHMQLFLAVANKLRLGARLILVIHEVVPPTEQDIWPIRLYSRIMGRWLMMMADACVAHSNSVKKRAIQTYHLKPDRVFVVPLGLYDSYYRDDDKQASRHKLGIEEKFVILYFGLIRKHKGVPYLVEAFNNIPPDVARNSRLIIAGEGWEDVATLTDAINASRYREHITLHPRFIPNDMVPTYFSATDVIVLPYLATAGSAVVSIAMAYGKPIIASDLETMRDCLADYEGGLFVPPGDVTAITDCLADMYRQHCSGEATAYDPPQEKSWDNVVKQYEQIAMQLIGHNRQG